MSQRLGGLYQLGDVEGSETGCCATSLKCSFLLTGLNMKMIPLKDRVLGYGLFRILGGGGGGEDQSAGGTFAPPAP